MPPSGEIRCEHCQQWFRSPIGFGSAEAFFSSTLIGNKAQCRHCGKMTGCNKENMRWRADDEGWVGDKT
jgi:hypothetical protein